MVFELINICKKIMPTYADNRSNFSLKAKLGHELIIGFEA